jgi:hypothetical protein
MNFFRRAEITNFNIVKRNRQLQVKKLMRKLGKAANCWIKKQKKT